MPAEHSDASCAVARVGTQRANFRRVRRDDACDVNRLDTFRGEISSVRYTVGLVCGLW